ncbi:MAG: hypothetical protein R3C59_08425 [Planctomycetaceae bacterium]
MNSPITLMKASNSDLGDPGVGNRMIKERLSWKPRMIVAKLVGSKEQRTVVATEHKHVALSKTDPDPGQSGSCQLGTLSPPLRFG